MTRRDRPPARRLGRFFHSWSLRTRLLVLIGLPLLLLQVAVVSLDYALCRADELAEMKQDYSQRTLLIAAQVEQRLAIIAEVTRSNAAVVADHPKLSDYERYRVLRRSIEDHPFVFGGTLAFEPWISQRAPYVYRTEGSPDIQTLELNRPDYEVRRQTWYRRARAEREPFWTAPDLDWGRAKTPVVTCIAPVLRNGGFGGVATLDLAVGTLHSLLLATDIHGGHLMLVDNSGTVLVSRSQESPAPSLAELAEKEGQPAYAEVVNRLAIGQTGMLRIAGRTKDTPDRWLLYTPVPTTGWSLLLVIDEAEALSGVISRSLRQTVIYGVGSSAILALLWWAGATLARRFRPLYDAAEKVAAGRLDVEVAGPMEQDEVGRFAAVFNRMVADLKESVATKTTDAAARQAVECELGIAFDIQQSLLPKALPAHLAIDLAGDFLPARYVAGDFYDWFEVDPETIALVIADVSEKGVPASLFMATARTSLRSFSAAELDPADTLTKLNRVLATDNPLTMFVTLFYGRYHIPSGRLVYANAGHNPPYIVRENGVVESVGEPTGPLLAVFSDAVITNAEIQLRRNDALVLYTDGVTEASDPEGRLYGEKRLEFILKSTTMDTSEAICSRIRYAVSNYCQGAPQDDVMVLAMRRRL